MTRKQTAKPDKKKFFGDHLEIKPTFMQRPKSMEEVMTEAFSHSTVEQNATVVSNSTIEHKVLASSAVEYQTTVDKTSVADNSTVEKNIKTNKSSIDKETSIDRTTEPTTVAKITTIEEKTTVGIKTIVAKEVPSRLKADVSMLQRMVTAKWQPLLETEKLCVDTPNYWQAYTKAWHWIEDEVLPYLDKDSKLTLRHCYRKAFGDLSAKGKFFAGQTLLAQEVGLSKRRIQDILEIFNLLGWVRKMAHHNRGGYKGTDYEMCLPPKAADYFLGSV